MARHDGIYMKSFTFSGGGPATIEATSLVMDFSLIAGSKNAANLTLSLDDGPNVLHSPGTTITLRGFDIARLKAGGPLGHTLTIIGQTK